MNLVCKSVLTLLAFYVLYSECITLPSIIKKNKKLVYFLIGFVYLYTYDTVEGGPSWELSSLELAVLVVIVFWVVVVLWLCCGRVRCF